MSCLAVGVSLGRRLVDRLTAEGITVRVAVRHPDPARIELRSMGFERVTVVPADVRDQASVAAAIAGADAVVNAVSAYIEKGGVTFEAVRSRPYQPGLIARISDWRLST